MENRERLDHSIKIDFLKSLRFVDMKVGSHIMVNIGDHTLLEHLIGTRDKLANGFEWVMPTWTAAIYRMLILKRISTLLCYGTAYM